MKLESNRSTTPARLIQTLQACRTVYFCGLSKNAGKTVALRQAMCEARQADIRTAVTSIGRDGEAFDAIYSEFAKPLVCFEPGDLVVTSEGLLLGSDACDIVRRFGIASPVGPIAAARVTSPCTIEVAGPSTVNGLRMVQSWVMANGVDLFLVDGALDRKAASLPDVCDGIVVSSGAAVSDCLEDVLLQTRSAIDMLRIPSDDTADSEPRVMFSPVFDSEEALRGAFAASVGYALTVEVQGAVTEKLVDFLMHEGLFARCRIVADCFAKVFINRKRWADYRRRGLNIAYRRGIRVLSLTVNPVSPSGPGFEPVSFLESMRRTIPEIPVFDVCATHYGAAGKA